MVLKTSTSAWRRPHGPSVYVAAPCRMCTDTKLPAPWSKHLLTHLHQLATMASHWDWYTCRQWSETVFIMIADGRLPQGWEDTYAIKDVQRDVCSLGTRIDNPKNSGHDKKYDGRAADNRNGGEYSRPEHNKDVVGKPCQQWNAGNDCSFTTSHGLQLDRKCHLCACTSLTVRRQTPTLRRFARTKGAILTKSMA